MIFKLGELFCGAGGIALGAKNAGFSHFGIEYRIEHKWANDYDADACKTFANNICNGNTDSVICKDVRKLNINKLGNIDAFAFGFPCNDFSVVGKQKGINGIFGGLYSYGISVLRKYQPAWFVAENVGGLKNSNDGNTFEKIIDDIINAGYNVVPHLYKFEQYEIPQARHRIIIVGFRNNLEIDFKVPILPNAKIITSKEAIETPPIPENAFNNELTKQSDKVIERLKYIKSGENAFTANLPEQLKLNVKGAHISQIYKRLTPDKVSYTITGSGGGGTHVYHWKENRALTNRERARLQTFPDNFIFYGSKESVRKQIGMAVPPKGAKIIFEAILKTFANIPYEFSEPNIKIKGKGILELAI